MPFLGLGLHVLIALYFAVHAVRTGQQIYWLFILFSFPLLGSLVYLVTVYLPGSGFDRGARRAVAAAGSVLDPRRELREARVAFDDTPTPAHRIRLANAELDAGQAEDAARDFEACLSGLYANDPDIRFAAARAHFAAGHFAACRGQLATLVAGNPAYRPEAAALLLARALGAEGRTAEARSAFEDVLRRFGSFEVKAEALVWAVGAGEALPAGVSRQEIERSTRDWPRHTRELHRDLLRRLDQAYARMR